MVRLRNSSRKTDGAAFNSQMIAGCTNPGNRDAEHRQRLGAAKLGNGADDRQHAEIAEHDQRLHAPVAPDQQAEDQDRRPRMGPQDHRSPKRKELHAAEAKEQDGRHRREYEAGDAVGDGMLPQQPVGHAADAGGGGCAIEGQFRLGGAARAVVGRRDEPVYAGAHHVAEDGALQQHERDGAQDQREHPRDQQIENDGAVVREFHRLRAPTRS